MEIANASRMMRGGIGNVESSSRAIQRLKIPEKSKAVHGTCHGASIHMGMKGSTRKRR